MPSDCSYCCAPPPAGATLPCTRNDECDGPEYCAGAGCGTVGGCMRAVSTSDCGGVVDEVCGCDGHTYTNDCWALAGKTRVASRGRCPGT